MLMMNHSQLKEQLNELTKIQNAIGKLSHQLQQDIKDDEVLMKMFVLQIHQMKLMGVLIPVVSEMSHKALFIDEFSSQISSLANVNGGEFTEAIAQRGEEVIKGQLDKVKEELDNFGDEFQDALDEQGLSLRDADKKLSDDIKKIFKSIGGTISKSLMSFTIGVIGGIIGFWLHSFSLF